MIFLDVDGVLHPLKDEMEPFEPGCMQALKAIVDSTGASIVLSSSWRCLPGCRAEVDSALAQAGIVVPFDRTPVKGFRSRVAEICHWLKQHPAVETYCVLDDMDLGAGKDGQGRSALADNFINTDPTTGLTAADVVKAVSILNGSSAVTGVEPEPDLEPDDTVADAGASVQDEINKPLDDGSDVVTPELAKEEVICLRTLVKSSAAKISEIHHAGTPGTPGTPMQWRWILVETEEEETWIFLHPVDNEHQVRVRAFPATEISSLLVQPELISLEYKKQHGISRRRGHLERHWIRIYSYLQPSFPQRIGMRCLCRLFDAVERLTTENYSRRSTLMLMPIPSGVWTTFPHASHDTLRGLVEWVNRVVVEVSPENAPQLLFLQEDAPDEDGSDDEVMFGAPDEYLSGACVVVDETGCFRLNGDNVTDDDVVRVAREYSNLQSLDLGYCSNITDASVTEVARRCSNLQTLNLYCCIRITDASVMEVGRRCSNLQTLNLGGCSNITDASVMEVGRRCSNLQTLNLAGSRNITEVSVMEVARRCSSLQTLNLMFCKNITHACKKALRQSRPKLHFY